ncbi:MAG: hypothetical protein JXQ83_04740 [Candidatus Glassbacteria bacterium]|nr:hypothetical protein [Candidatus Glassbacteria bacterium]
MFKKALKASPPEIRARAYVGLGDIQKENPKKIYQAIKDYRQAIRLDQSCKEAYYALARAEMTYGQAVGYREAAGAFAALICLQPDYRDAYRVWRDSILDKTGQENEMVAGALRRYLTEHPDSAAWWLDLARYYYDLGQADSALITIDRLMGANPEFKSPEVPLLSARCHLDLGDPARFRQEYERALEAASLTGDYRLLLSEAETIFQEKDRERWRAAVAAGTGDSFSRCFWTSINPDKLAAVNPWLVEHYQRLRCAELNYRLKNPHAPIHNDENLNRLLSYQTTSYYFASEIFVRRKSPLRLDQRGMLYVRLGEPDEIRNFIPDVFYTYVRQSGRVISRSPVPVEVWRYGKAHFIFEKAGMTGGDFIFRPLDTGRGLGDMMKAMESQVFQPDSSHDIEEYYVAQFMADDNQGLNLEIYQEQALPPGITPAAAAARYDTLWNEIQRSDSPVYPLPGAGEKHWLAVHSLKSPPGKSRYALRLKAGGETWNGSGELDLEAFNPGSLELSSIVLGEDPPEGTRSHERRGVRFIPRPSLAFSRSERIRVYLEYYNLHPGRDRQRSYKEWVDVIRCEGESGPAGRIAGKLAGLLTFGAKKENTSITHTFDREAAPGQGPVAETFILDSSVLEPGRYRLLIESRDNANGFWDSEAVLFEIKD